eukprot:390634_1
MVHCYNNKNKMNRFIIWGNEACYQCLLTNNANNDKENNVNSYCFNFKKLSYINSNKDWSSFSYAVYNGFILCFGGMTQNDDNALWKIFLYDINNDKWYDHYGAPNSITLPNNTYNTTAFLNIDKYKVTVHIIGGTKVIGRGKNTNDEYSTSDTNHWRLYLGYTIESKKK